MPRLSEDSLVQLLVSEACIDAYLRERAREQPDAPEGEPSPHELAGQRHQQLLALAKGEG